MAIIRDYAFASSTSPNPLDPIVSHLRIRSTNQYMYKSSLPELEIKQLLLDNGNIRYTLKLESDVKDLNIPLNIKLPNDQTITVVLSQKSVVIVLDNRFDIYAYIEANYLLRIERE